MGAGAVHGHHPLTGPRRTVGDLEPGDVLDLGGYGLPGVVVVLVAVTPSPFPGDDYLLGYEVVAFPDTVDAATSRT